MSCGIYKITNNVNNKIYIGQSINIEKRWQHHKLEANNKNQNQYNYLIHRAFRKYGIKNFSFEIIEECLSNELNDKEKYWIKYYNSYKNGYNMTAGGDTGPIMPGEQNPNTFLTNQDVEQIRKDTLLGLIPSIQYEQYKEKISYKTFLDIRRGIGWKGVGPDTSQYLKSSEYISMIKSYSAKQKTKDKENIWDEITKRKEQGEDRLSVYEDYKNLYSLSGFNKIWYKTKEGIKDFKKKVCKIDIRTNQILDTYESLAEAAEKNNCDSSSISKVCRGVRNTCKGFKWRYVNED